MDIGLLLVVGGFVLIFLIWIINPEHFKKINDAGWNNLDNTGKRIDKSASWLMTIFKMFKK